MILAPVGAALLQLGISRQREFLADATAAELLGTGAPLADALQTIDAGRRPALDINPATAPMYIVNPLAGGRVAHLFSRTPPRSRSASAGCEPTGSATELCGHRHHARQRRRLSGVNAGPRESEEFGALSGARPVTPHGLHRAAPGGGSSIDLLVRRGPPGARACGLASVDCRHHSSGGPQDGSGQHRNVFHALSVGHQRDRATAFPSGPKTGLRRS